MASLPLLVLSAGLRAAALPGWFWGPLIFLAVAARVAWWERGGRARGDYLGGVLYWSLAFSFLVHTNPSNTWFGLSASLGAALILGWTWVFEGFLFRRLRRRLPAVLAAGLALVAAEWLRSVWTPLGVGGVPWASLGLALAETPFLPLASIAGEHGLTLLAAFGGAWIYAVSQGCAPVWRFGGGAAIGLALAVSFFLPVVPESGSVRCLAIQPMVQLDEKHGLWNSADLFRTQVELTVEAFEAGVQPDLLLWAETMWPYPSVAQRDYSLSERMRRPWPDQPHEEEAMRLLLQEQQQRVSALLKLAGNRPYFMTGAHFYAPVTAADGPDAMSPRTTDFLLFESSGELLAHFPKQELVPFGERLPYRGRFPGAAGFIDWVWREYGLRPDFVLPEGGGPLPETFDLPSLGGAVCWENVFAAPFRNQAQAGARAFVILSNEDWFGSGGAEMAQMVAATRLRAIETGRPALRVTNTGDTVIVRSNGQVVREGPRGDAPPPGVRGWWDCDLPLVDASAATPYLRGGWLLAPLVALLAGLLALMPPWKRRLDPSTGEG